MAHGFVQQSRGRLKIDSTPGHGTRVRMIFPSASMRGSETEDEAAPDDGAKQRILVAEDNEDVREVAGSMLGAAGYAVVSAPNGE